MIIMIIIMIIIIIIMKDDQGELEGDVEKLLRKPSSLVREQNPLPSKPSLLYHHCQVEEQPASEEDKWRGDGGESLEKSETGDSGTCVDEILSPGPLGASKEEVERKEEEEYEEVFEGEDLVQLTVSSLASLGMLEDVPEHADEDNSELVDEQATVG